MGHGRHEPGDEAGDDFLEQVPLYGVAVVDHVGEGEPLQLDEGHQGGEQVVRDRHLGTHLETLDVAHLLDCPVVGFDVPMPGVLAEKIGPADGLGFACLRQGAHAVARLVFQPRPEQLHPTKVLQPNRQPLFWYFKGLHLRPRALRHRHQPVALHPEHQPEPVVPHPLQVTQAGVPTVPGHVGGPQPPGQHLLQHLQEEVVLRFARRLVDHAEVDGRLSALPVRVVQRHQVDALHRPVVLARPKIIDQRHVLAVRLVQHGVVHGQRAAFQVEPGLGLVEQVLPAVRLPQQEPVDAVVRHRHDLT